MDPDSSSDDDVNAGMAQLRLSGEKLLELPDELLAIIGAFAPTGGLVRSSRRCLLNNGHGEQLANMGPAPFQDYQISQFLRKDPEQTWEAAFRGPGPLPDGASRRRFVPRGPLAFPKAERKPRSEWIQEAA